MSTAVAALAFAGRDARIAFSYRLPFVMTILGSIMSLITFRFIAELVGDAEAIRATGDYFAFVVVGMVMGNILNGTLSAPAAAARREQVQGTLEVLAAQPVTARHVAAGWTAYPLLENILTSMVMLLIALPMGLQLFRPDWAAVMIALGLSAAVFAGMGILGAATVLVLQQAGGITKWISGGLTLISGVFFPVSLFPGWVAPLAAASPLTHSIRAMRGSLLEGRGLTDLGGELAALAIAALVVVPLGVAVLSRALRRARTVGTISGY